MSHKENNRSEFLGKVVLHKTIFGEFKSDVHALAYHGKAMEALAVLNRMQTNLQHDKNRKLEHSGRGLTVQKLVEFYTHTPKNNSTSKAKNNNAYDFSNYRSTNESIFSDIGTGV